VRRTDCSLLHQTNLTRSEIKREGHQPQLLRREDPAIACGRSCLAVDLWVTHHSIWARKRRPTVLIHEPQLPTWALSTTVPSAQCSGIQTCAMGPKVRTQIVGWQ
jgi:hypothetical protein